MIPEEATRRQFVICGVGVASTGCVSTLDSGSGLETLILEVKNETGTRHEIVVVFEKEGQEVYEERFTVEAGEQIEQTTGVTDHPLTVRASVNDELTEVGVYEWRGCRTDDIQVTVTPSPEIGGGCAE